MTLSFERDENGIEEISGMTYEFPYTMHERDLSNYVIPWHWHEELEFNYAYQGSILIETPNKTYTIQQGEAYFINTNVMTTKRKGETNSSIEHAHLFHPILLAGHYRSAFETKYLHPILKDRTIEVIVFKKDEEATQKFLTLLFRLEQVEANAEFEIRNLLSEAWLLLMNVVEVKRQKAELETSYPYEQSKKILNYIHQHYAEKITLPEISQHIGLSTREATRLFKRTFHQTPIDYLINYRIEQAKRLLRESDQPITNIAFAVGFNDSAYFSKIFKDHLKMTPKDYRERNTTSFSKE